MCFCSSITFSDSLKHVQKCLPFQDVFHLQSVISQPQLQILELYKRESQQQNQDQSLQCKQFMCLQMILLIQLQQQHSLTWMPTLCFLVHSLSLVFIQQQTLLNQIQEFQIQLLLEKPIITQQEEFKNSFKIISLCKILLLFLVWTSCLKKID